VYEGRAAGVAVPYQILSSLLLHAGVLNGALALAGLWVFAGCVLRGLEGRGPLLALVGLVLGTHVALCLTVDAPRSIFGAWPLIVAMAGVTCWNSQDRPSFRIIAVAYVVAIAVGVTHLLSGEALHWSQWAPHAGLGLAFGGLARWRGWMVAPD
jgi:hypothetical protein